jgi:transposase
MQAITTIGLDIAKSVFQIHGIGSEGQVVIRRQLKRRYVLAFFQKLQLSFPKIISAHIHDAIRRGLGWR